MVSDRVTRRDTRVSPLEGELSSVCQDEGQGGGDRARCVPTLHRVIRRWVLTFGIAEQRANFTSLDPFLFFKTLRCLEC